MTEARLPLLTAITPTPDGVLLHLFTEFGQLDVLPVPYGAVLDVYQRTNMDELMTRPSLHLTVCMGDVLFAENGDTYARLAHVLVPDSEWRLELLRTLRQATQRPTVSLPCPAL
jgi:hypothetical protein